MFLSAVNALLLGAVRLSRHTSTPCRLNANRRKQVSKGVQEIIVSLISQLHHISISILQKSESPMILKRRYPKVLGQVYSLNKIICGYLNPNLRPIK